MKSKNNTQGNFTIINLISRCASIIFMDISTGWLKSDIHTWIYPWICISTDMHIHGKPAYLSESWLTIRKDYTVRNKITLRSQKAQLWLINWSNDWLLDWTLLWTLKAKVICVSELSDTTVDVVNTPAGDSQQGAYDDNEIGFRNASPSGDDLYDTSEHIYRRPFTLFDYSVIFLVFHKKSLFVCLS